MSLQRLRSPQASRRRHAAAPAFRPTRRMLAVLAVCTVALSAVAVATVQTLVDSLGGNVPRVPDAFSGLDPSTRPVPAGGLTFLLVGIDTRADDPAAGTDASAPDGSRSDVLLIARLFEGGTGAAVAAIPRDAWVDVPGHGMEKINKAYASGGPSLLIRTVEKLTALRIDHFAKIDFAGFRSVVDSVGGIDVGLAAATSNQGVRFRPGTNHLDGTAALAYVRQRQGLVDVDLDRAQRQLNALRAVLTKVAATGALDDPIGLYRLLGSLGEFVSVDDTLSNSGLGSLTHELRGVPLDNISFVHAPVAGPGREGEQSVVRLEAGRCGELWDSLRRGTTAAYVEEHTNDSLGPVTR